MLSAQKWNKNEILFKSSEKVLWLPWYSDWSLSNSFPKPYSSVCVSIFYSWSFSWVWFKGLYFTNYWWNITSYNHWYNPCGWIGEKSYQVFEYLAFHWRIHNFGTYQPKMLALKFFQNSSRILKMSAPLTKFRTENLMNTK